MLANLITWWKEQMRDLVPVSLRLSRPTWRRALIVVIDQSDHSFADLFLHGRSGAIALGRHSMTGATLQDTLQRLPASTRRAAILRIAPSLFLERETVVPIAAERELKRVIGYEMDRLTPFRSDEVFWTCQVIKRDTERSRLHVRVTIVPKSHIQSIWDVLRRAAIVVTRIEAAGASERLKAVPLVESRITHGWLGPRTDTYALAGCGALATIAVVLPFVMQSTAWSALDARINAVKPQVALAEGLRKKIANSTTMTAAAAAARGQVGAPLRYIASLTEVLPDDTFLTSINLRQRKLTISGRSAAAARLIGAMAGNPLIHDPAFAASVTRDETNGGEAFSIRAELGS